MYTHKTVNFGVRSICFFFSSRLIRKTSGRVGRFGRLAPFNRFSRWGELMKTRRREFYIERHLKIFYNVLIIV